MSDDQRYYPYVDVDFTKRNFPNFLGEFKPFNSEYLNEQLILVKNQIAVLEEILKHKELNSPGREILTDKQELTIKTIIKEKQERVDFYQKRIQMINQKKR